MSTLRDLQEKRGWLHEQASELIPKSGSMSAEARKKFDKLHAEMEDVSDQIRQLKSDRMEVELRSTERPPESPIGGQFEHEKRASVNKAERDNSPEARAFGKYLRYGLTGTPGSHLKLSEEDRELLRFETRDMGIGSPTASVPTSVLVPQGFQHDIETALKFYGPMLTVSKILETATGQPLPYPTANDTSQVATIVGEGAQVSEDDVTVGNLILGAYKLSTGLVKVSLELLQDSAFDLENFLKEQFGVRLGRGLNPLLTNGTGTSQPRGFTVDAVAGPTAVGSSGNTGGAETGGVSIGSKDIVNLIQSLDLWYRPGSIFQMHDQTRAFLENVLDKFGRPLFITDPQTGRLERLYGYPVMINNDLPTIAVNAKTIYFGNFQKYLVRRVKDLSVLRLVERFADYGQVAFLGFARYDSRLIDAGTHPIVYLTQAAT
ncbi:MAG: phage major capsid protein [Terriglobia bacterium]